MLQMYNLNGFPFFSGDSFNKHQHAQKGRGRGASLTREKVISPNGRGKPLGE